MTKVCMQPPDQSRRTSSSGVYWIVAALFVLVPGVFLGMSGNSPLTAAVKPVDADAAVPACDAPTTIAAMDKKVSATLDPGVDKDPATAAATQSHLKNIREIGYASALRQRGCVGTLHAADGDTEIAYIVSQVLHQRFPDYLDANLEILTARFGNIDATGNFGNSAAPLGRDALERAVRTAVSSLHTGIHELPGREQYRSILDTEPQHEVVDIEPVGDCHATKVEGQFACEVVIVNNFLARAAVGMPSSTSVHTVLTFERVTGNAGWRTTPEFPDVYMPAVLLGRKTTLREQPDLAAAGR